MRENVIAVSRVKEEEPLRELLLPRDSSWRLCFFAVPLELLPFYRDRVFPVVRELGLVAVTADDVVSPGDNINAKIDALIDRAEIMVVDLSSPWTYAELRLAIGRTRESRELRKRLQLITIVPESEQLPIGILEEAPAIIRPDSLASDSDQFIERLAAHLRMLVGRVAPQQRAEPQRLLQAGEYRAAVISAMTLLETTLREQLGKELTISDEGRLSLRSLFDRAQDRGMFDIPWRRKIDAWVKLRNAAVHTQGSITKKQAQEVVGGVGELLRPI